MLNKEEYIELIKNVTTGQYIYMVLVKWLK